MPCYKQSIALPLGLLLGAATYAAPAMAEKNSTADPNSAAMAAERVFVVYAKVLKVTPIISRSRVSEPVETCRLVSTAERADTRPRSRGIEPPHRVLRSAIDSLIGGSRNRHSQRGHSTAHEVVEQCTQTERFKDVDAIRGYRVRYQYDGINYTKVMDHDPGDELALNARVTPQLYRYEQQ